MKHKFRWTTQKFTSAWGGLSVHECMTGRSPNAVFVGYMRQNERGLWEINVNVPNYTPGVVQGTWQEIRKLIQDEWIRGQETQ